MNRCLLTLFVLGCVLCLFGCQPPRVSPENLLLVSFHEGEPITYQMTAERETEIDLTTNAAASNSSPQFQSEKLDLLMVYTPVDVNPFGVTTVEVMCQKAIVSRTGFSGNQNTADAVQNLATRSFVLKLSPTGEITDAGDFERMVQELGKLAFVSGDNSGTAIKNPDMISDFLALQQMVWSPIASIPNQRKLDIGDTWQQQEIIAWPLPMYPPPSRITTYTLDSFTEETPRKATITSSFEISQSPIENYIRPYENQRFQMRGLYGFLRNYNFNDIEGSGLAVFNMDDGIMESVRQDYVMNVTATFMLPLGDSLPVLKVKETFSIQRVTAPKAE